jgi:hypothetical protein
MGVDMTKHTIIDDILDGLSVKELIEKYSISVISVVIPKENGVA